MSRTSLQQKRRIQIMKQLCYERKIQNFNTLKRWDKQRAHKLTIHRKIIDQIDQSLDIKVSQSNQFLKIINQFFNDLLQQKNKYLNNNIQNPQIKLKLNSVSHNIYKNSSRCLVKLYDKQSQHNNKQTKQLKSIIESSLTMIQDILLENQKQLMQIRTVIQLTVLDIQDYNMETLQKCDQLINNYNTTKNIKLLQSQNDFFIVQQQFLQCAQKQLKTHRQLGQHISRYLQFSEQKEVQKLAVIKKLIQNYIHTTNSSNQNQKKVTFQYLNNLKDILYKNTQTKYLQEYFSVQQLISKQLIFQLSNIQHKHQSQITIKYLKNFLKRFQYDQFDNRNLVLKILNIYMKKEVQKDNKSSQNIQKQNNLVNLQVFITVDGFINIYQSKTELKVNVENQQNHNNQDNNHIQNEEQQDSYYLLGHQLKAPLYSMKISSSLELNKISDIQLQVNVKKWGLMSFSQNEQFSLNLIFISEDQREEFIQFVGQLR